MKQLTVQETIVYGGAFNPPTLAHVAILRACFKYAKTIGADVWLMPSGNRLDKTIATPRRRRLEYVSALIDDASDGEFSARIEPLELNRGSAINPKARNVVHLIVETPVVSSTEVRNCLQAGLPIEGLVSPAVAQLLV